MGEKLGDPVVERITDVRKHGANPLRLTSRGIILRKVGEGNAGAASAVDSSEDDPPNPVQHQRSQAHDTRFERRVAGHLSGPWPILERHAADRLDLGVPSWVVDGDGDAVVPLTDAHPIEDDDGPDGKIPFALGFVSQLDGTLDVGLLGV